MRAKGNKKPRAVSGAGFFGSLQVTAWLPGYLPSARTSVGNKEYEYKGKKERAANLQQPGNRQKAVGFGVAAGVAALRHVIERKPCVCELSTVFFMTKTTKRLYVIQTAIHLNRNTSSFVRALRLREKASSVMA
jgi:hypothetical protein